MKTLMLLPLLMMSACSFHPVKMTTDPNEARQERMETLTEEANDAADTSDPAPTPEPALP